MLFHALFRTRERELAEAVPVEAGRVGMCWMGLSAVMIEQCQVWSCK